jgi:hypothetical protein
MILTSLRALWLFINITVLILDINMPKYLRYIFVGIWFLYFVTW